MNEMKWKIVYSRNMYVYSRSSQSNNNVIVRSILCIWSKILRATEDLDTYHCFHWFSIPAIDQQDVGTDGPVSMRQWGQGSWSCYQTAPLLQNHFCHSFSLFLQGPGWSYQTELPEWARIDWVDAEDWRIGHSPSDNWGSNDTTLLHSTFTFLSIGLFSFKNNFTSFYSNYLNRKNLSGLFLHFPSPRKSPDISKVILPFISLILAMIKFILQISNPVFKMTKPI